MNWNFVTMRNWFVCKNDYDDSLIGNWLSPLNRKWRLRIPSASVHSSRRRRRTGCGCQYSRFGRIRERVKVRAGFIYLYLITRHDGNL